jgi:protein phosphatase 1 regulatory subunit 7
MPVLEELWLGKNKITEIRNLSSLTSLRILSVQSNRLTAVEGLGELNNLEELYLSHNGIEAVAPESFAGLLQVN